MTAVHKANIMKLERRAVPRVRPHGALDYPDIKYDERIVDAVSMQLVMFPERFDILVMPNLYGDIISDLCAGLVGGLGVVPGANLGVDNAVFEAVHGSAPDIADQGIANPTALLLSAVMMLRHIKEHEAADRITAALGRVLEQGEVRTRDLGGTVEHARVHRRHLPRSSNCDCGRRRGESPGPGGRREAGRRTIIPPVQDEITQAVLAREEVARYLRGGGGQSELQARERINAYLDELRTTQRYPIYRALKHPLYPILRKIDRRVEHVDIVERATTAGRVIYISNHKSHLDYLVEPLALDDNGLRPPIIAAGINLFGGPLGVLHRHVTGAIPIRRDAKDPAYLVTLKAYIAELLHRHDLLFYLEGGRSYSGEIKSPKTGLLHAALQAGREDIVIIPTRSRLRHGARGRDPRAPGRQAPPASVLARGGRDGGRGGRLRIAIVRHVRQSHPAEGLGPLVAQAT